MGYGVIYRVYVVIWRYMSGCQDSRWSLRFGILRTPTPSAGLCMMYSLILVRTDYILVTYYALGCTGYVLGHSYQSWCQYKSVTVRTDQEKIKTWKYISWLIVTWSTYKICFFILTCTLYVLLPRFVVQSMYWACTVTQYELSMNSVCTVTRTASDSEYVLSSFQKSRYIQASSFVDSPWQFSCSPSLYWVHHDTLCIRPLAWNISKSRSHYWLLLAIIASQ